MLRDPRAFLWDVREAALAIQSFTTGMDVAAYAANDMAQSAVERKFEIIGDEDRPSAIGGCGPDNAGRVGAAVDSGDGGLVFTSWP